MAPAEEPREPLADTRQAARVLSSSTVFDGHVWDVRRERFEYNDAVIEREYIDHPGAVAVLAIDDEERVLLIKQYRHPVRTRDWEIPAGLLDIAGFHRVLIVVAVLLVASAAVSFAGLRGVRAVRRGDPAP